MREINIRESIQKKRLITKQPLIYHLFPIYLSGCALAFMLLMALSDLISNRRYNNAQFLFILFIILSYILYALIKNSINSFTFQVFSGKSKEDNIRIAQIVLQEFKKLRVINSNHQFIHAFQEFSAFDWGRELYMIFDNKNVLINFSSLARFDIPQPFRFYSDKKFERELINKFHSASKLSVPVIQDPKFLPLRTIGLIAWVFMVIAMIWLIIK